MPLYEYQCIGCEDRDHRVAGLDDHTARCIRCGGSMLRLDEDIFQPYWEEGHGEIQPSSRPQAVL